MEERMMLWFLKDLTTMTPEGWMEKEEYKWFRERVHSIAKEKARSLYKYLYEGPHLDVDKYYTEEYCEEG